jgi:hypothetical protein
VRPFDEVPVLVHYVPRVDYAVVVQVLAIAPLAALDRHAYFVDLAVAIAVVPASFAHVAGLVVSRRRKAQALWRALHAEDLEAHAIPRHTRKREQKERNADKSHGQIITTWLPTRFATKALGAGMVGFRRYANVPTDRPKETISALRILPRQSANCASGRDASDGLPAERPTIFVVMM